MSLEEFLANKKPAIIKKWRDLVIGTYPADTQRFLKKERDRFSNPVGKTIVKDIEVLYDEIVKGKNTDKIALCLDNIIRIRAVQDFKPSQAIGFVLQLKRLIRDVIEEKDPEHKLRGEIESLEEKIDNVALLAFDMYSQCRQKLYEIRLNETKNQVERLLKRANLKIEIPEHEPVL